MNRPPRWPRRTLLVLLLVGMALLGLDLLGLGPNVGLPVGYYGRFNRVVARIEASPDVEVVRTILHRDAALEDFTITVRTPDRVELQLVFGEAHTRPFDELVQQLERVGL